MTNKQQIEIEEMKNILLNSGAVTFEENVRKLSRQFHKDEFYVSTKDGHLIIDYSKFATALYNAWYRKVDENAAVLTREELNKKYVSVEMYELAKAFHNEKCAEFEKLCYDYNKLKNQLDQTRKETAKEFYDKVNENICSFKLENKSQEFIDGYAQAIADICGRLDQVAKRFGVEVDND